jgi:hypothetical protein
MINIGSIQLSGMVTVFCLVFFFLVLFIVIIARDSNSFMQRNIRMSEYQSNDDDEDDDEDEDDYQ